MQGMSVPSRSARVPAWPARTTGLTSSLLAPDSASYAWPGTEGHSGWRVRARPCHFRFRLAKRWLASARRSAAIGPAVGKSTYRTLAKAGSSVRVEHRARHPRSLDDVGHGIDRRVTNSSWEFVRTVRCLRAAT